MRKVQRLTFAEPEGVFLGEPALTDEELERLGAEADLWDLVSDDGNELSEAVLVGEGDEIAIRPEPSTEEREAGILPLGPDLAVWRSRQELKAWLAEWSLLGLPFKGSL